MNILENHYRSCMLQSEYYKTLIFKAMGKGGEGEIKGKGGVTQDHHINP